MKKPDRRKKPKPASEQTTYKVVESAARDPEQVKQTVDILKHMMDAIGVKTRTELATRAGIGAHSTLTRIDHPDATHLLSARTWLKLSKASGVPVTFLGDKLVGGQSPRQSYALKDPIDIRIMRFLSLLRPEGKLRVEKFLEIFAETDEVRRD